MAKIEFEGTKFEYDPKALRKYSVIKAISGVVDEPAQFFDAFNKLFAGKMDKVIEALDDDMVKIQELIQAVVEKEGKEAKN